jgi:hypothetical protein
MRREVYAYMVLRTIVLWLAGVMTLTAAGWESVQRLPAGDQIEVTRGGKTSDRRFVSASADSLVVRGDTGEESVARSEVDRVRVKEPGRRVRRGLLWTAIGAGAGVGLGIAACPGCFNEGAGAKYVGPGVAIGAGLGALGFLSSDYRTVYRK